jgi:hypothetical protein
VALCKSAAKNRIFSGTLQNATKNRIFRDTLQSATKNVIFSGTLQSATNFFLAALCKMLAIAYT